MKEHDPKNEPKSQVCFLRKRRFWLFLGQLRNSYPYNPFYKHPHVSRRQHTHQNFYDGTKNNGSSGRMITVEHTPSSRSREVKKTDLRCWCCGLITLPTSGKAHQNMQTLVIRWKKRLDPEFLRHGILRCP